MRDRKFYNIGKVVVLVSNKVIDCGCMFVSR